MFRHGLRVSEACALKLHQVDLESRVLHVARLKKGLSTTHPLRGDELRAIKTWLIERARLAPAGDTFFVSERRAPLNRRTAWVAIRRYGELAELSVEAHPHMLRHACGYALADQGAPCATRRPTRHGSSGCGVDVRYLYLYSVDRSLCDGCRFPPPA
jgi:site-specific recombinase XerD